MTSAGLLATLSEAEATGNKELVGDCLEAVDAIIMDPTTTNEKRCIALAAKVKCHNILGNTEAADWAEREWHSAMEETKLARESEH